MKDSNLNSLESAFLQVAFAYKLRKYFKENPPKKEVFDQFLQLHHPSLPSIVHFPNGQFNTIEDIQLGAENSFKISIGYMAITLWEAIREKTGYEPSKINPINSRKEEIAALSYMIRCCYAHSLVLPKWEIKNAKYKFVYTVDQIKIDLRNVDGQDFLFESIGSLETFWRIYRIGKEERIL